MIESCWGGDEGEEGGTAGVIGGISVGDGRCAGGNQALPGLLVFLLGIVKSCVINVCHLVYTKGVAMLMLMLMQLLGNRSPAVNRSVLAIGKSLPLFFSLLFFFQPFPNAFETFRKNLKMFDFCLFFDF